MIEIKFQYNSNEERQNILSSQIDSRVLIEEQILSNGNFLIFSEATPLDSSIKNMDDTVKKLKNTVNTLQDIVDTLYKKIHKLNDTILLDRFGGIPDFTIDDLKRLYQDGRITTAKLDNAITKGWITAEQKSIIISP